MLIDLAVALLTALAVFKGLSRGFIIAAFSFLAFFIGLAAAVKLSALAAVYIGNTINVSARWLPALAFFLVFFVVVLLVRLGAKALEGMARIAMLGCVNRLGGVLFYLVLYLIICSVVLFYATQLQLIKPEAAKESLTYAYIYPLGPRVINVLGDMLPFFENMFSTLEAFFGQFAKSE
jgi:membrane protein required for colicin V production